VAGTIPFTPSNNNYRLVVPIDSVQYLIDVHWNSFDAAWYFDLRNADESEILVGIKVVLGVSLGRRSQDPFFRQYTLRAVDISGARQDAAYDDLGGRVVVQILSLDDLQTNFAA
jgi:hypothetical protein